MTGTGGAAASGAIHGTAAQPGAGRKGGSIDRPSPEIAACPNVPAAQELVEPDFLKIRESPTLGGSLIYL